MSEMMKHSHIHRKEERESLVSHSASEVPETPVLEELPPETTMESFETETPEIDPVESSERPADDWMGEIMDEVMQEDMPLRGSDDPLPATESEMRDTLSALFQNLRDPEARAAVNQLMNDPNLQYMDTDQIWKSLFMRVLDGDERGKIRRALGL